MTQSAKIHVLVVVGPSPLLHHSQDSQWLNPTDSLETPVVQDWTRGSHKVTHNAGWGSWLSLLGSLFLLEEMEAQRRLLDMKLCWPWGGAMQSTCSCFPYPSDAFSLVLCGCFSLTPIF